MAIKMLVIVMVPTIQLMVETMLIIRLLNMTPMQCIIINNQTIKDGNSNNSLSRAINNSLNRAINLSNIISLVAVITKAILVKDNTTTTKTEATSNSNKTKLKIMVSKVTNINKLDTLMINISNNSNRLSKAIKTSIMAITRITNTATIITNMLLRINMRLNKKKSHKKWNHLPQPNQLWFLHQKKKKSNQNL